MTPKNHGDESLCPCCGGRKSPGTATFSADLGFGVVVVRHVECLTCERCGEQWVGSRASRRLETLVERARTAHQSVQVLEYAQAL